MNPKAIAIVNEPMTLAMDYIAISNSKTGKVLRLQMTQAVREFFEDLASCKVNKWTAFEARTYIEPADTGISFLMFDPITEEDGQ